VTGVDPFPEATDIAQAYAEKNGVAVNLVTGDRFSYNPKEQFVLVFDSGCMLSSEVTFRSIRSEFFGGCDLTVRMFLVIGVSGIRLTGVRLD
jgi:hypothetical protein